MTSILKSFPRFPLVHLLPNPPRKGLLAGKPCNEDVGVCLLLEGS